MRSSATFTFGAPGYGYDCHVDDATFKDCRNGTFTASGLGVGTHTFSVRAYSLTDDSVSGTVSRTWTVTAIDDDADGFVVPADCNDANPAIHPTAPDLAANGLDENCDGLDATPVPVTPAAPAPTPAPSDTRPKLDVALSYFMHATKRSTRFSALSLKDVPAGATITIKCAGGCPRKRATITGKRGTVALTPFRNRALKAGAKLTIEVTKPGSVGTAKVVTIRAGKRPTIVTKTLT
ncbi:putative metal-binding protein [Solirubrobacter pauli]|uniref:Putative metal-binding protein n=2 Tax=Solirubrobacter pauli TaxID=166793 RepID=A0A660L1Z4_9ACTN|nr:putative metal-binding protein [Solirubrobacter pauli]